MVDKTCSHDIFVIELNITAGERLRHTVSSDGDVTWMLLQKQSVLLSGSEASEKSLTWPEDAQLFGASAKHSLAMQFVGPGEVVWQIEQLTGEGTVIATLKRCTYSNPGGTDDHFDNVTIELV